MGLWSNRDFSKGTMVVRRTTFHENGWVEMGQTVVQALVAIAGRSRIIFMAVKQLADHPGAPPFWLSTS
jgi:hypothetical protein